MATATAAERTFHYDPLRAKNCVIYVYFICIICLKCTNGTQEAAKLQHTYTGPQAYHHSLFLGLKHCLNTLKPALLSILLSNIRSLEN